MLKQNYLFRNLVMLFFILIFAVHLRIFSSQVSALRQMWSHKCKAWLGIVIILHEALMQNL